jgi:DNA-binding response OmpR family regulator
LPRGKILVVDDDEKTREFVQRVLDERGYRVISASAGEQGLRTAAAESPDLIVLGIDMSSSDGIQTCQEIRKDAFIPIIAVGNRSDETDVVLSLGVGADYYLTKPLRAAEFAAYVEAAVRRETIYSRRRLEANAMRVKDLVLDFSAHELRRGGRLVPLSPTEFRLLHTLARNAGRIMTRDQLLDSVWEVKADGIYSRTVDVHIGRIRRKIGDSPARPRYIITVPGLGYKMVGG